MFIDQQKANSLVASFGSHRKVGTLVSTAQMAAYADCSAEESRRVLMAGIMSGEMKLVKSSGGSIVCELISQDDKEYNALMLQAGQINEVNRIAREAEKH